MIAKLLMVLKYLREKKVVFGDMKPANIMISNTGSVYLIDYGCSRMLIKNKTLDELKQRIQLDAKGTLQYSSPEVIQGSPDDYTSDYWSLGVLYFQMLSGTLPFEGNCEKVKLKISKCDYKFPEVFERMEEEREVIGELLEPKPRERLGHKDINQLLKHTLFAELKMHEKDILIDSPTIAQLLTN